MYITYKITLSSVLFLFLMGLFCSCEEVDVIENQNEFVESIIVRAELKANQKFDGVQFLRSLPFNEDYDLARAELKNVKGYLRLNENRIIPLHYISKGIYNSIYDVIPVPGDVYELFAIYNNKSIYSKTKIPQQPQIESAAITGDNFIETFIIPKENEVYGALWLIQSDTSGIKSPAFFNIYENTSNTTGTPLYVRTDNIPDSYRGSGLSVFVQVSAFDRSFLDYYQTRNNNEPVNDIFSQAGAPIKWNVKGEGAIGLFIGIAVRIMKVNE